MVAVAAVVLSRSRHGGSRKRRSSRPRTIVRTATVGPIPPYYLHNTARSSRDMQVENRFGQKGSGADKYDIKSPYPFRLHGSTTRRG